VTRISPPFIPFSQKSGVRFLWGNLITSFAEVAKKGSGSGCILAHCMGLGKTFTTICFTLTLLSSPLLTDLKDPVAVAEQEELDKIRAEKEKDGDTELPSVITAVPIKPLFHKILILAPVNTLKNWEDEYRNWTPPELQGHTNVKLISAVTPRPNRLKILRTWHTDGGVLIMGYEMFRLMCGPATDNMAAPAPVPAAATTAATATDLTGAAVEGKAHVRPATLTPAEKIKVDQAEARKYLMRPGPDVVIADEAHTIKDPTTKINVALSSIATKRRVALTGSPLQNNLEEYWCMVNWVHPRFLGTMKEFRKRFMDPMKIGESSDASPSEKQRMKNRAYVLHNKLKKIIDRKDLTELAKYLKPKREFVVSIKMTGFQQFMYKAFLDRLNESNARKKVIMSVSHFDFISSILTCLPLQSHIYVVKSISARFYFFSNLY
jgi:SNF2 family DNA or RNA helicase